MRGGFAAENVAYRNATRQYEGGEPTDMLKDAGKTFIGDVYQYYNIGTKLVNGEEVGAEEIANAAATPLSMVGLNIQANKLSEQQIPENLRNFSKEVNNKIGGLFKRNIVSSTAVEALKLIGELRGKNAMTIRKILKKQGHTKVEGRGGGEVWTKSCNDGTTASVRIDPAKVRTPPKGYADEVTHVHKETVPTAKVTDGNYSARDATTYDDSGNQSTIKQDIHIPIEGN